MNILITGAAGFIGSHVADKLIDRGENVIALDNFSDYYNPQFKEENIAHHRNAANYKLERADITDSDALHAIFQKHQIDLIIHLAAQAGVRISIQKPLLVEKNNIAGTYNILELAREFKINDVILASSSSVYGNQQKIPFAEDDHIDRPISPYAASKKTCELIAYTYHHLYHINCICLRLFTVYGERGRPDMSPYIFMEAILHNRPLPLFGDGSMERDFTYIDDIVDGICRCVDKKFGYEIINLGNSHPIALTKFIAMLEKITGRKATIERRPPPAGDVPKTFADISKAKRLLNWQPSTSLEQGLTNFYTWFKKNRL